VSSWEGVPPESTGQAGVWAGNQPSDVQAPGAAGGAKATNDAGLLVPMPETSLLMSPLP